jgi:hypothetical protein
MAQLIVGADGAAVDPSEAPNPMEVIAAAGEARPGIEDTDINDGWLIENTQQIDCGNGMMKYSIKLPGGDPFECTPFQIEHRRDMSKMWMSAVRGEIVARAGAAAERSRAIALKAKRDKQMAGAGILVSTQMPTAEEAAMLAGAVKSPPPPPPEHAREVIQQMRTAEMQKPPEGEADMKTAKKELAKAKANVAYWQAMIGSLQETEGEESNRKVEASRAERIARTLQTSTIATRK